MAARKPQNPVLVGWYCLVSVGANASTTLSEGLSVESVPVAWAPSSLRLDQYCKALTHDSCFFLHPESLNNLLWGFS